MFKYDLIIINRGFWPVYPVLGEGLLRLAEVLASSKKVGVIFQGKKKFKNYLKIANRGEGVSFFRTWAGSDSSSNILIRILDSVFFMFNVIIYLIFTRPKNIYISTDPPILIPFIVALYSKYFNSKFIYHIQDIHPEASNVVLKLNSLLFNLVKKIDIYSMKRADIIITLTSEMKSEIIQRSNTSTKILLIQNPSVPFKSNPQNKKKIKGFSFTGNLGRLQMVPFIVDSIKSYLKQGGNLEFSFAGGGIFSKYVCESSKLYPKIKYEGIVSANEAAQLSSKYEWALLPIEDKITRYAFPSKTSSYVLSGSKILAICGHNTNVSKWVEFHKLGLTVKPNTEEIVEILFKIEKGLLDVSNFNDNPKELKKILTIDFFVEKLQEAIFFKQ